MGTYEIQVNNLPELLRSYLEENGIKQNWFARRIGISETGLSLILTGKLRPSLKRIVQIQQETGIKFLN